MNKLSVFITTYNNERTLPACLESVRWADEIIVLDSYSTDRTVEIAKSYGCRLYQHKFLGYGPQKQLALEHTANRYVLLLDADEMLSEPLAEEIRRILRDGPRADGYEFPRHEQLFWRMTHPIGRKNNYLRFFDKTKGRMSSMPVHAAPKIDGSTERLHAPFYHFGDTSTHVKVDKVNAYSTGLVQDKIAKGKRANPWIMVFYPPLFFLRSFIFKRGFAHGWAGFINSVCMAFYVFLKYAKLYEHEQFRRYGDSLMPKGAPPMPPSPSAPS